MAAIFDTNGERLGRASDVVAGSSDYTVCGWVYIDTFATDPAYSAIFATMNGIGTYTEYATFFVNDVGFGVDVNNGVSGDIPGGLTDFSAGVWMTWAYVRSGTTQLVYLNRALVDSATVDMSATSLSEVVLGGDGVGVAGLRVSTVREFNAALTLAQLQNEWDSLTPIVTASDWTNYALTANGNDSINGYNLSATGAVTFSAVGPTLPSNVNCATAETLTIGTSQISDTIDLGDGVSELWWTFTTGASATVSGFLVSTDGASQRYRLSDGSCGTLNTVMNETGREANVVVLDASTQYWIRADNFAADVSEVQLRVKPDPGIPIGSGSLVIPWVFDSGVGYPRVIVFSSSGVIQRAITPFPEGRAGDSLGDRALQQDDGDAILYNASLTELTTLAALFPLTTLPGVIRANPPTRTFWVGIPQSGGTAFVVKTVTDAGALTGDDWTVATAGSQLWMMAPSLDETILYWGEFTGSAVKRYDLVNETALSNLAASLGSGWALVRTAVVLSDGSIVIAYNNSGSNEARVIRYDPNGAVLATYDPGVHDGATWRVQGLARVLSETDLSIWIWTEKPGGKAEDPAVPMRMKRVTMDDFTVVQSFTFDDFDAGIGPEHWEEPPALLGPDSTAVFWPVSAYPLQTYAIRRLRRAPHLTDEQFWQFYNKLQLDIQAGVGLSSGQGEDPQLMLRWSDDGGFTWSQEHWTSAGRIGEYERRALWRRMGRGRDRVFEVSMSDPVLWAIFDAFLDISKGTS